MESCLLICNLKKPDHAKSKVLFIDARKELRNEKTMSFLDEKHIQKIYGAYNDFETVEGFTYKAGIDEILDNDSNLNIPLYVNPKKEENELSTNDQYNEWINCSKSLKASMVDLFNEIK